ncbi:unnamed protein product [Rotaria sordida]|uniref:Large ribosomal subunit protein P1 n=1 Tax=Rotaria sordida TaxID=392033 RepID=A0A819TT02_9BILA|nr:unnamed protein product [Rotaria sordida]CAF4083000.1 unnamed protein product [Rotaria sordida]
MIRQLNLSREHDLTAYMSDIAAKFWQVFSNLEKMKSNFSSFKTNNMALSNDELACIYAALILADDNVDITSDKIATILKAANYEIEPYWPGLFASALEGVQVTDLIKNIGSVPVPTAASAPVTTTTPAADDKKVAAGGKEAPKTEEKEHSDDEDMGLGLFD